jgi:hypothetical protein
MEKVQSGKAPLHAPTGGAGEAKLARDAKRILGIPQTPNSRSPSGFQGVTDAEMQTPGPLRQIVVNLLVISAERIITC